MKSITNKKNIVAFVQARSTSLRYPKKVLEKINDYSLIELIFLRLKKSKLIKDFILVTSNEETDDNLTQIISNLGFKVFRGSLSNVLDRFYQAAKYYNADVVVRITGDCPIIDPVILDNVIQKFFLERLDYCNNTIPPTFPDGLDVEVFTYDTLKEAKKSSKSNYEKEHVTPYIYTSGNFNTGVFKSKIDFSNLRTVVDEPNDLEIIKKIFKFFSPNIYFTWDEILQSKEFFPELFSPKDQPKRNEGANMDSGQKLWKRALKTILGGTMLYSKRPDLFLPGKWPTYFSKAKGCKVFDLDGKEYIDVSLMGVGTNTLGYANKEVDDAVLEAVKNSNMSSLNCPEEVYLAERLCEIHPWASMCKFARTGGEANTIAIRIARAATQKEKIAFCGYHGWHDWYLSAEKLEKGNLNSHLMTGLSTDGVPETMTGESIPFQYNDIKALEKIIEENEIAAVKMEVMRFIEPEDDFLQKVRDLTQKKGIVLIFDECTSGFRETFGGLHKKYNITPDIAVFGKTLGNGYAITAVIGKKDIMELSQNTFISSTFWTERIGPTAALKTLEVMEKIKSWEIITQQGLKVWDIWKEVSEKNNVKIKIIGTPPLATFIFSELHLQKKTFLSQEMLKKGYLASTGVFLSTEHTDEILLNYKECLFEVFESLSKYNSEEDIDQALDVEVCSSGFKRIN